MNPFSGPDATRPWQRELARAGNRLRRWFEGRLVLAVRADDHVVPAERFLTDDDALVRAIGAPVPAELPPLPPGRVDRRADPRILASRFARLYSNATTGAALLALANGIGLDMSPARCAIVFRGPNAVGVLLTATDDDQVLRCAERPATWSASGPVLETLQELRAYVWSKFYGEHIAPLYTRMSELMKVSPNLLWSNSAEMVATLHDAAEEYLAPGEATPIMADARALLDADRLPGVPGGNPMRRKIEWVPFDGDGEFPREVQLRRMCCLVMHLSDRYGRLCQNCPYLPIEERVALVRERHGRSQSEPRGPAEQQAIVRGLAWLGERTSRRSTLT